MSQTTTPSPIEVVSEIYDAFARRDLDAVLARCSQETMIFQDPALPWGGEHHGVEGVTNFLAALIGAVDSEVTREQLYQAGDQVVQWGRTAGTVRHNGARFDLPECHIWTIRDGQVVEARFLIDSAGMLAALRA